MAVNAIRGFLYPDRTHSPLSNFFPCPIVYGGIEYPTNEHAFQAAKSTDTYVRQQVASLASPGQAKKMGRALVLRRDWEEVKLGVMRDIVRVKFTIPALRQWLLDTGDYYLEETNDWGDRFWGVDGSGENWLGFILMGVRAELRA